MSLQARERLRVIDNFDSLVEYLRDELDWPIEEADFEDLIFEYEPEELGIDEKNAAKIQQIKQLRPLTANQPWGIFFVEFEPKRLPVVALRRILSRLVIKKRTRFQFAEQAAWEMHDLLFILNYGDSSERQITFAQFSENKASGDLPTLQVLGWDAGDTGLHLDYANKQLHAKMRWPDDESALEIWRTTWSDAFTLRHREVITTSKKLALELAKLARRIRARVNDVLAIESETGPVRKLMAAFKEALVHDLEEDDFADMYAQTVTYGLLSARVSRPEGLVADDIVHMVPITNPFLKELLETFLTIGGRRKMLDFDELGINDVVALLRDANMEAVLRDFDNRNPQEDPVIHFYQDFLREYDARKRVQRGVYFTPRPVVSYIVRSVHELLQTEFGLEDGLADTTTWGGMAKRDPNLKIPKGVEPDSPFVKILDPATGTATFLVEVIEVIYRTLTKKWKKAGLTAREQQAAWNDYVPKHLLPRLYGYELMMAPYAIAHMKVALKLKETGFDSWAQLGNEDRVRIYLTNALEPATEVGQLNLLSEALAHEAQAVNAVKRNKKFTAVIGNPPYSSASCSRRGMIPNLMKPYMTGLGVENERKKGALQDDYIRFVALSQLIVRSSKLGVMGLITNNSYLDGTLHRSMRYSLINSHKTLRILNLHGSSRAATTANLDENVFDIMQGVSICLATLSTQHSGVGKTIEYGELIGKRAFKYQMLLNKTCDFQELGSTKPYFLLKPIRTNLLTEYRSFPSVQDIFVEKCSGIETEKDHFAVDFNPETLSVRLREFANLALKEEDIASRFQLKDTPNWKLDISRRELAKQGIKKELFVRYLYHAFDWRYTYYSDLLLTRPRRPVMRHMFMKNIALITLRQVKGEAWAHAIAASCITNKFTLSSKSSNVSYHFPLFLMKDNTNTSDLLISKDEKALNISSDFLKRLADAFGSREGLTGSNIFYFVYAILYSASYRSRYSEYLRLDFPRVPIPSKPTLFRSLVQLANELVTLHLMESPKLDNFITTLVGSGPFQVEKVSYSDETVWLDKAKTTGFRGVPEEVWNFHIGGYQVCEKWLKDRQAKGGKNPRPGRVLTEEDIAHYQKIVVALKETIRLMQEIDEVIEQHGGWPGAFVTSESESAK